MEMLVSLGEVEIPEVRFRVHELKPEFEEAVGTDRLAGDDLNFGPAFLLRPEQLEAVSDSEFGTAGEQATVPAQGDRLGKFVLVAFALAADCDQETPRKSSAPAHASETALTEFDDGIAGIWR